MSLPATYFDAKYRETIDPWNFRTSPYEAEKYRDTLAALSQSRYRRILEIGCSIGVLSAQLASRCDQLVSTDISMIALDEARLRYGNLGNITFELGRLPEAVPAGSFDAIVISEVAYYWSPEDFAQARTLFADAMTPTAEIVLVHWTPYVADYPRTGDQVHDDMHEDLRFAHVHGHRRATYRLDLFKKVPTESALRD